MSDSGFSGLPPGPRTGQASYPQSLLELKAKVIEFRASLKAQRVRQTLEGEVIASKPDGTTTIRTDKGEITVELRGRNRPPPGTRVEIEIPPSPNPDTPPRQVTVRPLPEQPPPAPQPETVSAAIQDSRQRQVPRLDARTTEDLVRHSDRAAPPRETPPVAVQPGDIIRLTRLPPEQLQDIIRPVIEALQARVTSLPPLPQVTLPPVLYEQVSPRLTLPPAEHRLLADNLPSPLPLYTQATAEPVPQEQLARLPAIARTPVQQLVSFILQGAQPDAPNAFAVKPSPVALQPAPLIPYTVSASHAALTPPGSSALQPLQFHNVAPDTTIAAPQNSTATSFTAPALSTPPAITDARIQFVTAPAVKLVAPDSPVTKPAHILPHLPTGPAGSISAEVIGRTAQNFPVLSFPGLDFLTPAGESAQNFILPLQASNLPAGTQLTLTPQSSGMIQAAAGTIAPFIPAAFFGDFSWPAMNELQQALQQSAPQLAQVLSNMTPNAAAPARLPMAALFFVAAIRAGDVSGWLGDKTVDALRRIGKGETLGRLNRDTGGMQRTAGEPSSTDWRSMALPMMSDGELHKMMLHYRHDDRDAEDGEQSRHGTRFIFDLSLTRMGNVQIDGLHRPQHGKKGTLDLIVRTTKSLSSPMQQLLRQRYIDALEQTELTGTVLFQDKPEQFIKIAHS
ncbi:MAG: hypothetical protein H6869_08925 [Rhodospirillales bacterium]|nr:hypothetical protein [Rhodospirillales bacterium]